MNNTFIFCLILTSISFSLKAKDYNVNDFGAKANGKTINTDIIQKVIDKCNNEGGGTVIFTKGVYLTGTIILKNNVTLHVDEDATIMGSSNPIDYKVIDPFVDATGQQRGSCLIGAVDADNIAITGNGIINGRGESYQNYNLSKLTKPASLTDKQWNEVKINRPFLLRFVRSSHIKLSQIYLQQAAAWACHFYQCNTISVNNVQIYNHAHKNNDGIDIDSSCDVDINGCFIDTGDDAVCIKATSVLPSMNVRIKNSILKSEWGAFKLGTESMGDFKNITFDSSIIINTRGGGIKILSVDGANIENVNISNINMHNVDMPIFVRLGERLRTYRGAYKREVGSIKGLNFNNVYSKINTTIKERVSPGSAIFITGTSNHPIDEVSFNNVNLEITGSGDKDINAKQLPELEKQYPEYISFGVTPAYGITARHVNTLNLKKVNVICKKRDSRPLKIMIDVKKCR